MADDKKISGLTVADALTGAELVEVVQGGVNKQSTTQDIADLGGGGGAVDSVNGETGVVVLDAGDIDFTPAGNIAATDVQAAIQELDTEKVPVSRVESLIIPFSDMVTPITATTNKKAIPWPYASCTITGIKGNLGTAQTSGSIFTIDVNKNLTTILSTKITIDNGETTSTTAATQPVISVTSITLDDWVAIDVDQQGDNTAKNGSVTIYFTR